MDMDVEKLSNTGEKIILSDTLLSVIRRAVLKGDVEQLEQLHNRGLDFNATRHGALRPIHYAAKAGKIDVVVFLLTHGANIDVSSTLNETALYFAAKEGHLEVVKRLLQFGPDVNNEGNKKAIYTAVYPVRTLLRLGKKSPRIEPVPLMYDATNRYWQHMDRYQIRKKWMFESLLEYGFIYELEPGCDPNFFHGVVELRCTQIVEELLKYGADANMEHGGETPLLLAIKTNQPDITDLLLFYGADVNAQDGDGKTPIYYAARSGNLKLVQNLLTHGATVSAYSEIVHAAIRGNSPDTVEELVNRGSVDINDCTVDGSTALQVSLKHRVEDVTALLLDKGANVSEKWGKDQKSPLHYASFRGDHRNCETMLKKGAAVGSKNIIGRTPLHEASTPETVKILLQYGADINARDRRGRSPLHIAAKQGLGNVVDALLKSGADIDSTDGNGETALHSVFKPYEISVFPLLLNYGADVNICDKNKCTPGFNWFHRDDYFIDEKMLKLYVFHIVRMQAGNWYVSEEILRCMQKAQVLAEMSEEDLKAIRERCEEEIRKLHVKKIQYCNISYGACLTKNIISLAFSLNNDYVVQGLQSDTVSAEEFPSYALMLKTKFRKAMERKALVDQCYEIFGFLTRELALFPTSCAEEIIQYLSNHDLQMLIAAWNGTSQCTTETESMTFSEGEFLFQNFKTDYFRAYCDDY